MKEFGEKKAEYTAASQYQNRWHSHLVVFNCSYTQIPTKPKLWRNLRTRSHVAMNSLVGKKSPAKGNDPWSWFWTFCNKVVLDVCL